MRDVRWYREVRAETQWVWGDRWDVRAERLRGEAKKRNCCCNGAVCRDGTVQSCIITVIIEYYYTHLHYLTSWENRKIFFRSFEKWIKNMILKFISKDIEKFMEFTGRHNKPFIKIIFLWAILLSNWIFGFYFQFI